LRRECDRTRSDAARISILAAALPLFGFGFVAELVAGGESMAFDRRGVLALRNTAVRRARAKNSRALLRVEGVNVFNAHRSPGAIQRFVAQGFNFGSDGRPVLKFLAAAGALRLHPSADRQSERFLRSVLKNQLSCDIGFEPS
jgi:hypothetical protein